MKKILLIVLSVFIGLVLIGVILITQRQAQARREIEAQQSVVSAPSFQLATTSRLEILPLYEEATTSGDLISGHGVSYLVRTDSGTILLDVGNNPDETAQAPFAQNMQTLNVDWNGIDAVVISHPHPDHIGGTNAWRQSALSFGDLGGAGVPTVYLPAALTFPGASLTLIPSLIRPDIATTGVLSYPEVFPISLFTPKGSEQALVVDVEGQGLVLITGCGHPGVERLVERAETLYNRPIAGVVGGLHYEGLSAADVQPYIQYLQTRQPGIIALSSHDSSPEAMDAFQSAFGEKYHTLRVGEMIQFP